MSTFDDNSIDYDDENPPEESNNRTFLFAAGGLGLLVLLALLCLGAYVWYSLNNNQSASQTALAESTRQAATIQAGLTQTAVANALTATAGATATLPPTNTPVIAQATNTAGTPGAATVTPAGRPLLRTSPPRQRSARRSRRSPTPPRLSSRPRPRYRTPASPTTWASPACSLPRLRLWS
jgi:hypothetical protein